MYRIGNRSNFEIYLMAITLIMYGIRFEFIGTLIVLLYGLLKIKATDFLDKKLLSLLLFCVFYLLIDPLGYLKLDAIGKIKFILLSFVFYSMGKRIFLISRNNLKLGLALVMSVNVGFAINTVFSMTYTMKFFPEAIIIRQYYDYFSTSNVLTHGLDISMLLTISLAVFIYLAYIIITSGFLLKTSYFEKMIFIAIIVSGGLGMIYSNILQNRTPFFIFVICAMLPFVLAPRTYKSYLKFIFVLVCIVLLISILNFGALEEFVVSGVKNRLTDGVLNAGNRDNLFLYGIEVLPFYPMGGYRLPQSFGNTYFHNFWLDIVKVSGFLPLIFILYFQLSHIKHIKIAYLNHHQYGIMLVIICVAIFLLFLTSPIPEGGQEIYYFSLLLLGYVRMFRPAIPLPSARTQ